MARAALATLLTLLMATSLTMTGCSSKKSKGRSGNSGGATKTVKDDGDDDGETTPTPDPCGLADAATDNCAVADGSEPTPPPDGAFYETVLHPAAREACHTQGLMFDWVTQDCLAAQYPAAFTCDRAGVLQAFGGGADVATVLDAKAAAHYLYDQCGVLNGRPVLILVCPTTNDQVCQGTPVCKTQEDLDVSEIKVCSSKLSL